MGFECSPEDGKPPVFETVPKKCERGDHRVVARLSACPAARDETVLTHIPRVDHGESEPLRRSMIRRPKSELELYFGFEKLC